MSRPAPSSTYRLQLHKDFTFDDAGKIADYLRELGISHVYCSPYLQAAPGSMHGYDVIDHSRVNEELGGPPAHHRFCQTLGENDLGQVLDIVPNHMAIAGRKNAWWWDVLENGPASPYASYFDVEWNPPEEKLRNKVLVPILGDHYGRVLDRGEITVKRRGGSFEFHYFDHELPVAPRSLADLLAEAAERAQSDYLRFLAGSFTRLPLPTITDRQRLLERHRDKDVLRGLLTRLCEERPDISSTIDQCLEELNKNVDRMDALLDKQNFRISYWKTAVRELGHRRFFDVNTLIGLRVEDPQVFHDTHRLLIEWLDQGVIDGIRVDHPDGLRDPRQYFDRLAETAPNAWIIGEKILEPGEVLRNTWKIAGTTGYDFLNALNGVFIDPEGETGLTEFYSEFTSEPTDYAAVAHEKKLLVLRDLLGSDVNRLTALFVQICESDRNHRDYTRHEIHHAVRELVACFPVYRTYIRAEQCEITDTDVRYIDQAIRLAKEKRPDLDPQLFAFLETVLTLKSRDPLESEFVMRFQQFSGPAMAKGVEDTAFYCYNRLLALNEVGGDPGRFAVSPGEFHDFCEELQSNHPETMVSLSTHDTKRSEDVRARLQLLSEIPSIWRDAVCRWSVATEKSKTDALPDRNTEYLFYQTLVGAWPISVERVQQYMQKACREAKQHTNWLEPNETFEKAVEHFVEASMANADFTADVEKFVKRLVEPGRVNSLAQTLVKFTAPGVPDTYQGMELWDLSLVDPDNRRPVDYELRRKALKEVQSLGVEEILRRADEGLPKIWTCYQALRLRREKRDSFSAQGAYVPLRAKGDKAAHVLAFQRGLDVLTVVPRLVFSLDANWGETTIPLPAGTWKNCLSGEAVQGGSVRMTDLLRAFPVALLVREKV